MPKILEGICAELSFPWVSQFSFFFFPFFFWELAASRNRSWGAGTRAAVPPSSNRQASGPPRSRNADPQ